MLRISYCLIACIALASTPGVGAQPDPHRHDVVTELNWYSAFFAAPPVVELPPSIILDRAFYLMKFDRAYPQIADMAKPSPIPTACTTVDCWRIRVLTEVSNAVRWQIAIQSAILARSPDVNGGIATAEEMQALVKLHESMLELRKQISGSGLPKPDQDSLLTVGQRIIDLDHLRYLADYKSSALFAMTNSPTDLIRLGSSSMASRATIAEVLRRSDQELTLMDTAAKRCPSIADIDVRMLCTTLYETKLFDPRKSLYMPRGSLPEGLISAMKEQSLKEIREELATVGLSPDTISGADLGFEHGAYAQLQEALAGYEMADSWWGSLAAPYLRQVSPAAPTETLRAAPLMFPVPKSLQQRIESLKTRLAGQLAPKYAERLMRVRFNFSDIPDAVQVLRTSNSAAIAGGTPVFDNPAFAIFGKGTYLSRVPNDLALSPEADCTRNGQPLTAADLRIDWPSQTYMLNGNPLGTMTQSAEGIVCPQTRLSSWAQDALATPAAVKNASMSIWLWTSAEASGSRFTTYISPVTVRRVVQKCTPAIDQPFVIRRGKYRDRTYIGFTGLVIYAHLRALELAALAEGANLQLSSAERVILESRPTATSILFSNRPPQHRMSIAEFVTALEALFDELASTFESQKLTIGPCLERELTFVINHELGHVYLGAADSIEPDESLVDCSALVALLKDRKENDLYTGLFEDEFRSWPGTFWGAATDNTVGHVAERQARILFEKNALMSRQKSDAAFNPTVEDVRETCSALVAKTPTL